MSNPLVSDALWEKGAPLLPVPKPGRFRFPGRKRIDDRKALTGILFVLKSGIPWDQLPQEMGWGSGMTCWRRLKAWHDAGVWERLHHLLLSKLRAADGLAGGLVPAWTAPACGRRWGGKPAPIPQTAASPGVSIMGSPMPTGYLCRDCARGEPARCDAMVAMGGRCACG